MTQSRMVGDVLAAQVRRYRLARGWSVRELADQCAARGAPELTPASIGNIERGRDEAAKRRRRDVTVDELLVLALVLAVPPALLIFPFADPGDVQVLPDVVAGPHALLRWFAGDAPLPGTDEANANTYAREAQAIQQGRHLVERLIGAAAYAEIRRDRAHDLPPGSAEATQARTAYAEALRMLADSMQRAREAGLADAFDVPEPLLADLVHGTE